MSTAANRIAELSPLKLARFLEQVKKKPQENTQIRVIQRQGCTNSFPLSFAQQRLWVLDRFAPGTSLFNTAAAWWLEGPLNLNALAAAFTEMHRRHESLRTTFAVREGHPVQVVAPPQTVPLPIVDLSTLPEREQRRQAHRIATDWGWLPLDLEHGPLMRTILLRTGAERHALLMTLHHIITDGWSFGILYQELSSLYNAYSKNQPSPLPELEVQYGDFAVWQRGRLQGEFVAEHLSYWKKQLADAPARLELPTDYPRSAVSSHRGAAIETKLSSELTEQIKSLSRHEGVTLFMITLAAFQVLLCRYSGQEDICVGSPLAGRKQRQTEPLIGFFINTLVLRTDLSGNPSFRELLARVREMCLAAHAHQDAPFERLVAELKPDRRLGQSLFFQVWFAFQNVRRETPALAGLTLSPLGAGIKKAQFDLSLLLWEEAENIGVGLIYDKDLFEAETAARILKDYELLLQQVSAQPEQRIWEIPFYEASPAESTDTPFVSDVEEDEDQFVF
jgi:hypothetical protein